MHRMLVIEDEPAMNQLISDILSQAGFHVTAAFDGVGGLEAIRFSAPDLVILDIFMPEKDGLELLIELRRFARSLPVLVISGKQHLLCESSMSLARQLGATAVLAKPFTPPELLKAVSKLGALAAETPNRCA